MGDRKRESAWEATRPFGPDTPCETTPRMAPLPVTRRLPWAQVSGADAAPLTMAQQGRNTPHHGASMYRVHLTLVSGNAKT